MSMNMKKIDYIFCSTGAEQENYQVVREKCWNSQFGEDFFASDHHPVYSTCDFSWCDDGVDFDGAEYSAQSEDNASQTEINGKMTDEAFDIADGRSTDLVQECSPLVRKVGCIDSSSGSAEIY